MIVLLFILLMLPMTMFGQTGDKVLNEMPSGQIKAIHTVLTSLPQKDSLRYVILNGDTIWEKKDAKSFFQAVISKAFEDNTVKKVCGVSFGDTYDNIRTTLYEIFGRPVEITESSIHYKNLSFGEEQFDDVSFIFQQEGNQKKNYLNQVVFIKAAKSREDATQVSSILHKRLSCSFWSIIVVDDELIVGGLPPIPFLKTKKNTNPRTIAEMGFGFELNTISPKDPENPYLVRLMYGPYNY